MEQNIIGTTIAALRREKGLTQDALAAQLGVSAQAVSKWENGLSCPDILMLPEIAEYFGVSVDALFGRASVSAEVSAAPPRRSRSLSTTISRGATRKRCCTPCSSSGISS